MGSKDLLWYGKINDYNAGWGVSNQDLERCFFIFIILRNGGFLGIMSLRNLGISGIWEFTQLGSVTATICFGALRYFLERNATSQSPLRHVDNGATR